MAKFFLLWNIFILNLFVHIFSLLWFSSYEQSCGWEIKTINKSDLSHRAIAIWGLWRDYEIKRRFSHWNILISFVAVDDDFLSLWSKLKTSLDEHIFPGLLLCTISGTTEINFYHRMPCVFRSRFSSSKDEMIFCCFKVIKRRQKLKRKSVVSHLFLVISEKFMALRNNERDFSFSGYTKCMFSDSCSWDIHYRSLGDAEEKVNPVSSFKTALVSYVLHIHENGTNVGENMVIIFHSFACFVFRDEGENASDMNRKRDQELFLDVLVKHHNVKFLYFLKNSLSSK